MLTFHHVIDGCRTGNAEAWRAMVAEYTPVLMGAAQPYQCGPGHAEAAWREALVRMADHGFAALKEADVQSDREFYALLRSSLLERMAGALEDDSDGGSANTAGALEAFGRAIKPLPLLHQNVIFLNFSGYSEAGIEQILRVSPAIATDSVNRVHGEFGAEFGQPGDSADWKAVWLRMTTGIREAGAGECAPVRSLIRILDGQVGWHEKEPVERHIVACLHCLEAWVGLQEIVYWMRRGTPLAPEQVDEVISVLPLRTKSDVHRAFFKRAFR